MKGDRVWERGADGGGGVREQFLDLVYKRLTKNPNSVDG